ncbi:hypothetical protein F4778DRAFT_769920 [Xylariomycetidae sp. FL2044]|nr:hypothetical protein F4778DRAFT_769920 [Xylariomycetidae sp. FL2044]
MAGIWRPEKIRAMESRLQRLQGQVTNVVILCLWDSTKRSADRELHFANQLNDVVGTVKRIEHHTNRMAGELALQRKDKVLPVEKAHIARGVSETMFHAGDELIEILWQRGWKLESLTQGRLMALDFAIVSLPQQVELMTDGLKFPAFSAREAAITPSFEETYRWIFSPKPKQEKNKPLWSNFPEWFSGTSDTPYWITGKPGSGKSTMIKFITQNNALTHYLEQWSGSLPILTHTYCAWKSGYWTQKSWEGLQRTLIFQALKIDPTYSLRVGNKFPVWDSWECGRSMKMALFIDGLDEFDIPATKVVGLIQELSKTPWTEFDDAFHKSPMLQMHLLTQADMTAYVAGELDRNRGYDELKRIYPLEASSIPDKVVSKSQGVFLWVALVGSRLSDILQTLEEMPTDLLSLYDTIWYSIMPKLRHEASWMIQFILAAYGPVSWFTMWLADESRSVRVDIENLPNDIRYSAGTALKRRLATRTKGILEISGESVVFLHRTARDWAADPVVLSRLREACETPFEPFLALASAEALDMALPKRALDYSPHSLWMAIYKVLWYAAQVPNQPENTTGLVQILDDLDQKVFKIWQSAQRAWPMSWALVPGSHWASRQSSRDNTFLGIAAQIPVIPYVKMKVSGNAKADRQKLPKTGVSLLENGKLGWVHFQPNAYAAFPTLPAAMKEEMVQFLETEGSGKKKTKLKDFARIMCMRYAFKSAK